MKKDYFEEVKELLRNYELDDIEYGKPLNLLLSRIKVSKEEVQKELLQHHNLVYTEKQERGGEVRYALFFIYSNGKGRLYTITFRNKIRVITIIPLGKTSVKGIKKEDLYSNVRYK